MKLRFCIFCDLGATKNHSIWSKSCTLEIHQPDTAKQQETTLKVFRSDLLVPEQCEKIEWWHCDSPEPRTRTILRSEFTFFALRGNGPARSLQTHGRPPQTPLKSTPNMCGHWKNKISNQTNPFEWVSNRFRTRNYRFSVFEQTVQPDLSKLLTDPPWLL